MKKSFVIFLLLLTDILFMSAQVGGVLWDSLLRAPVADAFVFYDNSSIGTNSDGEGVFTLPKPTSGENLIVISHLNYQTLYLKLADFRLTSDTICLVQSEFILHEAIVVQKAEPRIRNRRLKDFTTAFFGENAMGKMSLLNPEVLLLIEENDTLKAEAIGPLEIENRLLGYNIKYYLDEFYLTKNQDTHFSGKVFFEELESDSRRKAKFNRNRKKAFEKTSIYFFNDLVNGQLDTSRYLVGLSKQTSYDHFEMYTAIGIDELLEFNEDGTYSLRFPDYFTIIDNLTRVNATPLNHTPLLRNSLNTKKRTEAHHASSFLRSKSNIIHLDKNGYILNQEEIEEYGYWSKYRTAYLLPYEFLESQK